MIGIMLALIDDRPGDLSRVHRALSALCEQERVRLGVIADGHLSHTARSSTPSRSSPGHCQSKSPTGARRRSSLLWSMRWWSHRSRTHARAPRARSLLTGATTSPSPVRRAGRTSADAEASWGHRQGGPTKGELFFGYFLQAATMVRDENSAEVPEIVRRILVTTSGLDPVPAFVPVLGRLQSSGVALGDVLCDSGYAHRVAEHWALPVRRLGGRLVMDLHPNDRGTQGTYEGAICFNGGLYCPVTPPPLFSLEPLARNASREAMNEHDRRCAELSCYRLGRITADDADGYHRVACPAELGKLRCPAKSASLTLGFDRPEVLSPPDDRPKCCLQRTVTVPVEVNAKTAQKHEYPSKAHRRSYARRTAVERSYATLKDPASTDTTRGWCRVMGLCEITLMLTCAVVVRNLRVHDAFMERQREQERRQQAGLAPKTRRRRRKTIAELVESSP